MTQLASPGIVEVAQMWHYLAECQRNLDTAASAAYDAVSLPAPHDEDPERIGVTVDRQAERLVLRIELTRARPETLRAWVTPNLALLRAKSDEGQLVERLVRLPHPVDAESAEIERTDGVFTISLDRRSALPKSLWPPVE